MMTSKSSSSTTMSAEDRLTELYRIKVYKFENEMKLKLNDLKLIENEINEINVIRSSWLNNILKAYETSDKDIYLKRLEILKIQANIINYNLTLDLLRVEGFYESQTLTYLSEFTKPYDKNETEDSRRLYLEQYGRDQCNDMIELIKESLLRRTLLSNNSHNFKNEINNIQEEMKLNEQLELDELNDKILYYDNRMNEIIKKSKDNFYKITNEYLILRHNSKVVKEILLRSQNDATYARESLQTCLDNIILEG